MRNRWDNKKFHLFALTEQIIITFAANFKFIDMEKNGIIDYEKVFGLEITTAKGQVFSRKRIENGNGDVSFVYSCYLGIFHPVYDPNGLYFMVDYKGNIIKYIPDDDSIYSDLMSNDADVLKKAINYVYQRAKRDFNKEKYGER